MIRRTRTRTSGGKHRRARPVAINPVQIAIANAQALAPQDVARQRAIVENALARFREGTDCPFHWRSLVDTANVAKTLASMRLGGGTDAQRVIDAALQVLAEVHKRAHQPGGTWTLRAAELDALHWLARLHCTVQLPACSYGEFERALHTTNRRINQALAGNASPGGTLVVGDVAGQVLTGRAGA